MADALQLGGNLVPVMGVIGGCAVAIVWILAAYYRSVQVADMDATLKMEMIQRGMSAEDIERVLHAQSDPGANGACQPKKTVASFQIKSDKHAPAV